MTTQIIDTFANDVCEYPYGLIVVAGPKKSGRTNTMRRLESAVSQMNRGRYFRIGDTPPEDTSIINFIETFKPIDASAILTDEEVVVEFDRYKAWERKVKFGILPSEPAAVFIDDLDQSAAGLSSIAIDMALVGVLTIVSVEADSAEQAVQHICGAARADSGPNSPLRSILLSVIVQKPAVNPETGDEDIQVEFGSLDDKFWETL